MEYTATRRQRRSSISPRRKANKRTSWTPGSSLTPATWQDPRVLDAVHLTLTLSLTLRGILLFRRKVYRLHRIHYTLGERGIIHRCIASHRIAPLPPHYRRQGTTAFLSCLVWLVGWLGLLLTYQVENVLAVLVTTIT